MGTGAERTGIIVTLPASGLMPWCACQKRPQRTSGRDGGLLKKESLPRHWLLLLSLGRISPFLQVFRQTGRWILSPYNLEPRKNLRRLLEAFAQVPDPRDEMRLVLFGRAAHTPEREREFDDLLARLSIGRKVIRTGFVSDAALATMYRRCTVFVFPSLYEGFGLPVLEAMANGACVVVGDRSAMKEVVDQAGVLMDVDSPSAMARAIITTLADERGRQRLSEKARARSTAFTLERLADQTIAAYRFASRQFVSRMGSRLDKAPK